MEPERARQSPYPPIGDYALIGDCHSAALVSKAGSVDWCCMPRFDQGSCFGRLLDWRHGGFWSIAPVDSGARSRRRYRDQTLVLETRWQTDNGVVDVADMFAMRCGGREDPYAQLLRLIDGRDGTVEMAIELVPRFDYGYARPWIRQHGGTLFSAIGGEDGLVIWSDCPLEVAEHALRAHVPVRAGERRRISIRWVPPHRIHPTDPTEGGAAEIDRRADETEQWWERWSSQARITMAQGAPVLRSAIVLKALTNAPTGAIAAAATTSLPEDPGGERNWDYRCTWIRDSAFALQAFLDLGFDKEAQGFRRFIERTAAGDPEHLQVLYGLGGAHRLTEVSLDALDGYRQSRPVRVGNAAHAQLQLDVYGELLDLAWHAAIRGFLPDRDYWEFLCRVVETVTQRWQRPDHGLWEARCPPRHFVHSKVMCWAAVDRGLRLAERGNLPAPTADWRATRRKIRDAIERHGYDAERGVFVQSFDRPELDAALLLLPSVDFIAYDDQRMVRTVAAIERDLGTDDGLLRRYLADDGLSGDEGAFLACSFWLVECLAKQGELRRAQDVFSTACKAANDIGLFAEEYSSSRGGLLGNIPQGLSHYSHIRAALVLERRGR